MKELLIEYVDVLIPFIGAVICLMFPRLLFKKNANPFVNERTIKRLRLAGLLLLVVAASRLILKIVEYN